ncbi:MAG: hypothetical protein PHS69_09805 [Firmicutes bacterium]|nr:hypothetical protein [Bacillota bacterium]
MKIITYLLFHPAEDFRYNNIEELIHEELYDIGDGNTGNRD